MKYQQYILFFFIALLFTSCIKDDFLEDEVDPVLRITNPIDTIELETTYQFSDLYLNNVGQEELVETIWSSTNPEIISVDQSGLITAISLGESTIRATSLKDGIEVFDEINLVVGTSTVVTVVESITGDIMPSSFYVLEGSFELSQEDNGLKLAFEDNYKASTALPGLYVYLSNNRNSIAGALELGMVSVFNGEHEYEIENVGLNDYQFIVYFCKPFNVKVGDGEL